MVRLIIWIIVGLLALSFFGISLEALYDSPTNQENMNFLSRMLADGWNIMADFLNGFIEKYGDMFEGGAKFFNGGNS